MDHGEPISGVFPPAKGEGILIRLEKGEQVLPLQAQAGIDATKYCTADFDIARASQGRLVFHLGNHYRHSTLLCCHSTLEPWT